MEKKYAKRKYKNLDLLVQTVKKIEDNSDTFTELFIFFKPLIRSLMKTYQINDFDEDDWFQESAMVCYKACLTFDPSRGSKFSSYYKLLLKRRIFTIIRMQETNKRKVNSRSVHFEDISEKDIDLLESKYKLMDSSKDFESLDISHEFKKVISKFNRNELLYLESCLIPGREEPKVSKYVKRKVKKAIKRLINSIN